MVTDVLFAAPPGADTPTGQEITQDNHPQTLYITLGADGACKMGTCSHCVIEERGRPANAWEADGDRALDFDRAALLASLADLGVEVVDRHAYICP